MTYDDRPHIYYDVYPAKRIEIKQYSHRANGILLYSGTFTVAFRCYDPFGKLFLRSYDGSCSPMVLAVTGTLPVSMMPAAPHPGDNSFLVYNCGTERAP